MHLALNMAKMGRGGFSPATVEEMQYLIKKGCAEVREEKKRGVEYTGHKEVKTTMVRHLVMLHQHQTDGCLPC